MKKNSVLVVVFSVFFISCEITKSVVKKNKKPTDEINVVNKNDKLEIVYKNDKVVDEALTYLGVRYKYGGTTNNGVDCSGLVYNAYSSQNIYLPRISRDMAKTGDKISLKDVKKGDLLFFKTNNRRNAINHVGLVVSNDDGQIEFVHATISEGVIVSLLSEKYWAKAFVKATKILD